MAFAAICVAVLCIPSAAWALTPVLEARLAPSYEYRSQDINYFGLAVDLRGDTAAVGDSVTGATTLVSRHGDEWIEDGHSVGGNGDAVSVALGESHLAVASRYIGESRVYPLTHALDPASASGLLGSIVAIDSDLLVTLNPGTGAVSVYRFREADWQLTDTIETFAPTPGYLTSIAVSGSTFVVPDVNQQQVVVYEVQDAGPAVEVQRLPAIISQYSEPALALTSDTLVVGADGNVDVYRNNGTEWVFDATLAPSKVSPSGQYGRAVDVEGDVVAVGAAYDSSEDGHFGSVFVFERSGGVWTETYKLKSESPPAEDMYGNTRGPKFGLALAMDDGRLLVGAPSETYGSGYLRGAAYIYRLLDGQTAGIQPPSYLHAFWVDGPDLRLEWRNPPVEQGFTTTRLVRRIGTPPTGPNDPSAKVLYEGTDTAQVDSSLPPGATTHYAVYARNASGVWSTAARASMITFPSYDAAEIPVGNDVRVSAGGVTVTFERVTSPGALQVRRMQPDAPCPGGRRWVSNGYVDIHPTAQFSGSAVVEITYDASDVSDAAAADLLHYDGSAWRPVTTQSTTPGVITGTVTGFSPFAVAESTAAPATPTVVSTPASSAWSIALAAALALGGALHARRRTLAGT